eukprot:10792759-Lingulodinium_polyedra.AAC.1
MPPSNLSMRAQGLPILASARGFPSDRLSRTGSRLSSRGRETINSASRSWVAGKRARPARERQLAAPTPGQQ